MPKNMMFKPKNGIQFFYPDLLNFPKPGDMQSGSSAAPD